VELADVGDTVERRAAVLRAGRVGARQRFGEHRYSDHDADP
jgi:hypothetical protein